MALAGHTRRKCFISYHHSDEYEVRHFIDQFDHYQDVLIARGIDAGMSGDILNSNNDDYIKTRIREEYLRDTTVTIVLVGRCTWARKFVDWEIAASLRNTLTAKRSGLLAVTLPSIANDHTRRLPARVQDNIAGDDGYASWWQYPSTAGELAQMIEKAYANRVERDHLVNNTRSLRFNNSNC